ncbi:MAG: hypothetical protein H7A45_20720 [Verrucomicrobiales bacterium]|nr:hypothetical protein [Verrucomicrobiales bacterium]
MTKEGVGALGGVVVAFAVAVLLLWLERRKRKARKERPPQTCKLLRPPGYPRRFESRKTGRAGYQPACANEWIRGVCEKPRVKCSNCLQQRWLPVTDEVIRWHLSGRDDRDAPFVMGAYPMLRDESCQFLAVDFDRDHRDEDALAYLETCRAFQVPAALERSRSGNGGHVWFFFEESVPAILARKLRSFLLTETMERRPELGLRSYDRLFPNQDTLPQGGFGNLIALPLQRAPRNRDNSVFVREDLRPQLPRVHLEATTQGGLGVVAQPLGVPDGDQKQIQGPGRVRAPLQATVRDEAVVDPAKAFGDLAEPLRTNRAFVDHGSRALVPGPPATGRIVWDVSSAIAKRWRNPSSGSSPETTSPNSCSA